MKHLKTEATETVYTVELTQTELTLLKNALGKGCDGYDLYMSMSDLLEDGGDK